MAIPYSDGQVVWDLLNECYVKIVCMRIESGYVDYQVEWYQATEISTYHVLEQHIRRLTPQEQGYLSKNA
jgi:hypothetical protein